MNVLNLKIKLPDIVKNDEFNDKFRTNLKTRYNLNDDEIDELVSKYL